jgi:hypothetical protein
VFSFFEQARDAFRANAEGNLRELGIDVKGKGKGEWIQAICPLCSDKNGSASFSQTGHLRCHQCGRKQDLFDWTAELWTCSSWESCQKLCGQLGVSTTITRARGSKPPKQLTKAILRAGTMDLWTEEEAAPFRKFLAERKLDDAKLLEQFGVCFTKGELIFAQFDYFDGGKLRPCYRHFVPIGKKWFWRGTGAKGGFWPYILVPDDATIWICEGEWDVMTAWMRLRLQDVGIYAFTWTSTGKIPGHMVPDAWRGKEVHFLYDNDTWQGKDVEPRAPSEKQLQEQELRYKKLQYHAAGFAMNKCQVYLRHVPIDPLENYGADLRDWVDAGETNIDLLPPILFKDVREKEPEAIEVQFSEVSAHAGKRVKFQAMVETITSQDRALPKCTAIDCEMGTSAACRTCLVPGKFPQLNIWWQEYPDELANAMVARNFSPNVQKSLLGTPRNCPRIRLKHTEYVDASIWTAVLDDEKSQGKMLTIVSEETPTLSGEVEVDGYVHHLAERNTVMVMAKSLRQLDRAKIDLSPYVHDLHNLCPYDSDDVDEINDYIRRRAADLAYNVTKIHGREEVHIAHDMLMHSAIGYMHNGMPQRGWLDMGIVGDTRTGKSMVFAKLFHWHGIGKLWAAMNGITLAGLTMGSVQSTKGYILKPGLFPRSHKKVLVLDEFHVFDGDRQHPIMFLQSARDLGHCDSIKISGSRSLPAAVRFCTISNWPRSRGPGRFPCQQFLTLYQKPEALSRADFILVVEGDPAGEESRPSEWSDELARALILRAWAMDLTLVDFDPGALELAREFTEECRGVFSERIPLFTPEASFYSVLRMAIAIANLCFSHQEGNYYACRVRRAHVEWVCIWLRHTWALSKYDKFSENEMRRNEVLDPFDAEHLLVSKLDLFKPEYASGVFESLLMSFRESELPALTGMEIHDSLKWFAKLKRLNVFQKDDAKEAYAVSYMPTKGGELMLRNLIELAEQHPEVYTHRIDRIRFWKESGHAKVPDVQSLTLPLHFLTDDEDREQDRQHDQASGEVPF